MLFFIQTDLFAVELILTPVFHNDHWTLAVINNKKRLIQYLDSMKHEYPDQHSQTCLQVSLIVFKRPLLTIFLIYNTNIFFPGFEFVPSRREQRQKEGRFHDHFLQKRMFAGKLIKND